MNFIIDLLSFIVKPNYKIIYTMFFYSDEAKKFLNRVIILNFIDINKFNNPRILIKRQRCGGELKKYWDEVKDLLKGHRFEFEK